MRSYGGQIDNNDLAFVIERFGFPLFCVPSPIIKGKILPHVSRFVFSNGRVTDVFHVKPIYYQNQSNHWRPLSEVSYHYGNHKIILNENWSEINPQYLRWLMKRMELINGVVQIPINNRLIPASFESQKEHAVFQFTVTTTYPDPNPETTTVDGWVAQETNNAAWSTLRSGAGNNHGDAETSEVFAGLLTGSSSNWWGMERSIFLFDTSAIPDTDTIDSAIISIYGSSKLNNNGSNLEASITSSTPASNTAIVNGDYAQVGTTSYSSTTITYSSYSTSGYNDYTLNASGLAAISKTGVTKLGARSTADLTNTEPTRTAGNVRDRLLCYYADNTGTSNDPKLAVTHSSPSGTRSTGGGFSINSGILMW